MARNWFKLMGVTGAPVPDDWIVAEPSLLELMRFPKHRPPTDICNYERLIAYAVQKQKVFAVQTRAGGIRIQTPYGPKGSVTYRWPNEMDVETHAHVPDLRDAPTLSEIVPDFTEKYGKKFWRGSHWEIEDDEYEQLERAIMGAGGGQPAPLPPKLGEVARRAAR